LRSGEIKSIFLEKKSDIWGINGHYKIFIHRLLAKAFLAISL